jgi:hypothetical protein
MSITAAIGQINVRIAGHQADISQLEMVKEAVEQEGDKCRDRMVVDLDGEYVATYRWEINPQNGYLTVQLVDGSVMPVRLGRWCPLSYAADHFGIERKEIKIDDPDKGL